MVKKNQHLLRGTQSDETQIFLCSFQLNWLPGIVVSFPHPVFHTQHNVSFVQVVHTCIHVFYFKIVTYFFIFILLGPLYLRRESNTQTLFSTWLTPWLSYCTCFTVLFFEWQYLSFYDLYDLFIFECSNILVVFGCTGSSASAPSCLFYMVIVTVFIAGLPVSLAAGCLFTCTSNNGSWNKDKHQILVRKENAKSYQAIKITRLKEQQPQPERMHLPCAYILIVCSGFSFKLFI